MTWRRIALAVAWLIAAGWGIYYVAVMGASNGAFVVAAFAHFVIGYAWAHALIARPLTMPLALFGILCAGAFTRMAVGLGTTEVYMAWAGPLAAIALTDVTRARHIAYAAGAFALGLVLLSWLSA